MTRLAALHASLTSRLALQPTLLALNGRLELVMSQIELRQEKAIAASSAAPSRPSKSALGKIYVEGESESEEEDGGDSDEGSVEDVVLGSGGEESGEEIGEESDEDGDEDDFGPRNGRKGEALLELEASEGSEEESDGDSEEEDGDSEAEDE